METSCLKNENVADAFETLIEITNIELKKNNDIKQNGITLNSEKHKKKKNNCACPISKLFN